MKLTIIILLQIISINIYSQDLLNTCKRSYRLYEDRKYINYIELYTYTIHDDLKSYKKYIVTNDGLIKNQLSDEYFYTEGLLTKKISKDMSSIIYYYFEYDEENNLIRKYAEEDGELLPFLDIRYRYENNLLVEEYSFVNTITFKYISTGSKIVEKKSAFSNIVFFTYYKDNRITKEEKHLITDNERTLISYTIYLYEDNLLQRTETYKNVDGKFILISYKNNEYLNNQLITVSTYTLKGETFVWERIVEYEYDKGGNLIQMSLIAILTPQLSVC